MINHNANEIFFDDVEVPAANLIGEGKGFRYILSASSSHRKRWATRARAYAKERTVFDRPIGKNQGVASGRPRHAETEAATMVGMLGLRLRRRQTHCSGPKPTWQAARRCRRHAGEACFQTPSGFGFAREYDG